MAFCGPKQLLRVQPYPAAPPRHRRTTASADPAAGSSEYGLSSPQTHTSKPWSRKKTLALAVSSAAVTITAAAGGGFILYLASSPPPPGNTGGGGWGRGGGGGGGGGGDGGSFWSRIFSPRAAFAEEEQTGSGGQVWDSHGLPAIDPAKISEILFFDRRRATTVVGAENSFFEMVSLRPGSVYTKAQLQKELDTLASCGMFEKVDLEGKTKPDGTLANTVSFTESTWQSADAFRCINVGLLPQTKQMEMDPDMTDREKMEYFRSQERGYRSRPLLLPILVQSKVMQMLREQGKVSTWLLQRIRDRVQKWFKQLRQGHVFNIEAGKQALWNLNSLALFSNIEVNPCPDEKGEGGIIVKIKLKEMDQKSAEVSTEWSLVPGRQGRPTLASIQLGGTVEHRNIKGLNRSILGSVTSSNLLNPQNELAFKLEYVHPYVDSVYEPQNCTFRASCFNSRKLSPVFVSGPGLDEVPPLWIDRVGFKATITEALTRQSKFTYGLVMEEITNRDETSSICTHGSRPLPSGGLSMDGPPTTLSGTGVDRMAFAQANLTHDNTKFVNGAVIGERDVLQSDQGLRVGSNFPFFYRYQLTVTRFIQLKPVEEGAGKPPPPILVLHGCYGGFVGDLPSYDAFFLGGPYSVRGYNIGELGACRNIVEFAAELRIPIKNTYVYAFAEHGTDLGSSKDVKGNPTEFFRRAGQGSSYGAGVKLGLVRAEYAVDHNSGTGALFFRFGERF